MILNTVCFSSWSAGVAYIKKENTVVYEDILGFRYFLLVVLSVIFVAAYKTHPFGNFPSEHKGSVFLMAFPPMAGLVLVTVALAYLPVSITMVILQTSPFWASLLAFLLLGSPITRAEIAAMLTCFGAVISIALQSQPSAEVSEVSEPSLEESGTSYGVLIGTVSAVLTAFITALRGVMSTKMATVHFSQQVFYFAFPGFMSLVIYYFGNLIFTGTLPHFMTLEPALFLSIFFVVFLEVLSCLFLTLAFLNGNPASVSLFTYLNLVWAFLYDYFLFHTKLSLGQIIPVGLILMITIIVGYNKSRGKI